jgi:prolipoprotein diacylglyceryltransferase
VNVIYFLIDILDRSVYLYEQLPRSIQIIVGYVTSIYLIADNIKRFMLEKQLVDESKDKYVAIKHYNRAISAIPMALIGIVLTLLWTFITLTELGIV